TTQRIPIFIELKNISKNKSVIDLIKEYLATWIGDSDEILNLVLQSGKISIFLDAFDEIDPDLIQSTYKYINDLCQNYRKLTVIVSSRPDTIIINSQFFNVIDLQPYYFKKYYLLVLMDKYAENVGFKYSKKLDDFKKFIETLFICKRNFGERIGTTSIGILSFGRGYNGFGYMLMHYFSAEMYKLNIIENRGIFNVYGDKDYNTKAFEKKSFLDIYTFEDILGLKPVVDFWENICNRYEEVLQEVKEIETQVTDDDLGI
ncbi:TPA: hypothetical protein VAM14_002877, partial [Acinetobacter baumannii]|nr:hypothetical protein [Acinetobacter baumannii]